MCFGKKENSQTINVVLIYSCYPKSHLDYKKVPVKSH